MDINCDMGEIPRLLNNNVYSDLMDHVTSISLACGGHAGDPAMMRKLVKIAKKKNVKIVEGITLLKNLRIIILKN